MKSYNRTKEIEDLKRIQECVFESRPGMTGNQVIIFRFHREGLVRDGVLFAS